MDNFIVSARKYRPATFESVVGQSHITSTLKNAIARNQLAHAYLFCGPRGVGKTTCARIFAKAINCTDPRGSEACGECESCRSFSEGRSFSIHELDAASNNSVDDIRTLTDQVRVPPQVGRYSVYIIDEVHMLSAAAFNAFLKTLEEPPAHAIFILATTEKHKIIPTILSRCQIYDFNRIRVEDSVGYLKHIAGMEGVTVDDESLNLIAQKADGGMRDALSMFDKAVAFCGGELNFREVARTLNVLDYDTYFTVTDLAGSGDYKAVLLLFDEVLRKGFSGQTFISGLSGHLRDLLMCKDPGTLSLLEVTGTLLDRYRQQSARYDAGFLFRAISLLSSVDSSFRTATNQRLHVELGLMKLCSLAQKKTELTGDTPSLPPLEKGGESRQGNNSLQAPSAAPQNQPTAVKFGATNLPQQEQAAGGAVTNYPHSRADGGSGTETISVGRESSAHNSPGNHNGTSRPAEDGGNSSQASGNNNVGTDTAAEASAGAQGRGDDASSRESKSDARYGAGRAQAGTSQDINTVNEGIRSAADDATSDRTGAAASGRAGDATSGRTGSAASGRETNISAGVEDRSSGGQHSENSVGEQRSGSGVSQESDGEISPGPGRDGAPGKEIGRGNTAAASGLSAEGTAAVRQTPGGESRNTPSTAGKSLSGVSIRDILNGNGGGQAGDPAQEDGNTVPDLQPDPRSEEKISGAREEFLKTLGRKRPRVSAALENMLVVGNRISASVASDVLREDILLHRKEILGLLAKIGGINGPIEIEITVREDNTAVRPIRPEDKLEHLRSKNPLVDELRRELNLEME